MRQVHRAGEKTFIDFSGKRPHIVDRRTGEEIPVELFVAVLGASSYTYAEATESQELPCWVGAHMRMVEYFGGSTRDLGPGPAQERRDAAVPLRARDQPHLPGAGRALRRGGDPGAPGQGRRTRPRSSRRCWWPSAGSWPGCATGPSSASPSSTQAIWRAARGAQRPADAEARGEPARALRAAGPPGAQAAARAAATSWPSGRRCRVNIDYHVEVEHHYYSVPYQLVGEKVEARYTALDRRDLLQGPAGRLPPPALRPRQPLDQGRAHAAARIGRMRSGRPRG